MREESYKCDRCRKKGEVTNLSHPIKTTFFEKIVPTRYSFNVDLCDECLEEYKKLIKRFMKCEE